MNVYQVEDYSKDEVQPRERIEHQAKVVSILPAGGSSRVPLLDLKLKDDFDLTFMRSLI